MANKKHSSRKVVKSTLGELVQAVSASSRNLDETCATLSDMVQSGIVRFSGARRCRIA